MLKSATWAAVMVVTKLIYYTLIILRLRIWDNRLNSENFLLFRKKHLLFVDVLKILFLNMCETGKTTCVIFQFAFCFPNNRNNKLGLPGFTYSVHIFSLTRRRILWIRKTLAVFFTFLPSHIQPIIDLLSSCLSISLKHFVFLQDSPVILVLKIA